MSDEKFYQSLTSLEKGLVDFYVSSGIFTGLETVLEIGSGWGIFARALMMAGKNLQLTTVDKIPVEKLPEFVKNTKGFELRITAITGDSTVEMPEFLDESFDVVFVDGDHGYEGAMLDLKEAMRIVKKEEGRMIIIDDVLHHNNFKGDYRVMKALRDFALERQVNFHVYPVGNGVAIIKF